MANWNQLPREVQQRILRPICEEIVEDFEYFVPKKADRESLRCPRPLIAYHNLMLSCKSVAEIIKNLKVGEHSGSTTVEQLQETQYNKLEDCWEKCYRKADHNPVSIAQIDPPREGPTFLQKVVPRVGKFWKNPEGWNSELGMEVIDDMLCQLPRRDKAELFTVLEDWIKERSDDYHSIMGYGNRRFPNTKQFSVRHGSFDRKSNKSRRVIFEPGRWRMKGSCFRIESIETYSPSDIDWDPEGYPIADINLRMPGESFPLSEECVSESDTWWCFYTTEPDDDFDTWYSEDWYMFNYREGKLFRTHFRRVFGPGSLEDESFKNSGENQWEQVEVINHGTKSQVLSC
jgi:hypothetical protein